MADNKSPLAQLNADLQENIIAAQLGLGDKYLPVDNFRKPVRDIFNSMSYDYDCHRDKIVMAAMMAVCGVVGRRATLVSGKYKNHPSLFGVIVDRPGGVKSSVISPLFHPLRSLNKKARDNYNGRIETAPEDKKLEVHPSYYMTEDATSENLKFLLATSKTGIIEYHDELSGMFSDWGKYSNGKSSDRELRLSLYDGLVPVADRNYDRGCKVLIYPDDVAYSMFGTIQYQTLKQYFKPIVQRRDGLYDRCLFIECPAHKMRHRSIAEKSTFDSSVWKTILDDLDRMPQDKQYYLSEKAVASIDDYSNEIIDIQNEDLDGDKFQTRLLTRVVQNCLRISLIIHLLNNWEDEYVSGEEMDMAVRMMRVFVKNSETCYQIIFEDEKDSKTVNQAVDKSELIKQYYLTLHKSNRLGEVSQNDIAKMFDVSQPLVFKIRQSLIKSGLIDNVSSSGKVKKMEEPSTPIEEGKNTNNVVSSSEGETTTEENDPTDLTEESVPSPSDSEETRESTESPHNPPKIRGDNDDKTLSNEISDIGPTS